MQHLQKAGTTTSSFLYIYSVLVTKNYQEIRFRCLVHKFSFTDVFKRYHSYGAAILKENPLWLLPFYMAMATSCCYENVHRMMRTAIVLYLFKLSRQAEIQHLLYLIINVVCKYLRQFLGTSFDVATLPIYCNIEWGEGA